MDVRFWGPSGWKLLHSITFSAPVNLNTNQQQTYKDFFNSLCLVLPCKYCRISLCKFMEELPIDKYIHTRDKLSNWMFKIHNKVNNKLRKQGFLHTKNPPYKYIKDTYSTLNTTKCTLCNLSGWDFIYSIAFNYPKMKDITKEKKEGYYKFFTLLPEVFPNKYHKEVFQKYIKSHSLLESLRSRTSLEKWLYGYSKYLKDIMETNSTFTKICYRYETYRSGCEKKHQKKHKKTCREKKLDNKL
jgi:hypothetical protein